MAAALRVAVEALAIPHLRSPAASRVTVSVGVASVSPDRGGAPDGPLRNADAGLYEAKRSGRNRVRGAPFVVGSSGGVA